MLANSPWNDIFPTAEAYYLPMILSCYKHDNLNSDIFRFYNMWISADSFYSLVQANWDKPVQGCTMFRVVQRLKWLKTDLKQLNREGFSRI